MLVHRQLKGGTYTATVHIKHMAPETVQINFRAGGDYTVKREGSDRLSYGSKLKKSNFTNDGFVIERFDGSKCEYKLEGVQS